MRLQCRVDPARYLVRAEPAQMMVFGGATETSQQLGKCFRAAVWQSVNHLYHHVSKSTYHSVSYPHTKTLEKRVSYSYS